MKKLLRIVNFSHENETTYTKIFNLISNEEMSKFKFRQIFLRIENFDNKSQHEINLKLSQAYV
ncbi:CLUMA_CG001654, isoform A [Clunio marinus]|uniref:CLUMA_CG001654, isoform A n=1 Tax=Clunio marinus TaxID=568069 RepID=A0A1J1HIX4_9DIPT|nr:CLUMA_CG001654, isoform A [Clunio marinus]